MTSSITKTKNSIASKDAREKTTDQYSDSEIDEFNEVLTTLRSEEVAGWIRSLQLRGVALPDELKDDVILLVGERRIDRPH